jgi:leucyl/phenylalanyl-tRNA--protein transferase
MNWELTPGLLLRAYASGIFPMAESADDPEVHWVDPSRRGIIPLGGFHISRSLRRAILSHDYEARFDSDFSNVVAACSDRSETWINDTIFELYQALHKRGAAHSQEVWRDGELIGGVYGVALGSAFFGESMFSRRTNGSKIALAYLIDRLNQTGFTLFDTQFITPHLLSLGGKEIARAQYLELLEAAIDRTADITRLSVPQSPAGVIQRNGQTS